MVRYPHTAVVKVPSQSSQDSSGDYTEGALTQYISECRDVPASSGQLKDEDGQVITYQSVVYFPVTATVYTGCEITVSYQSEIRLSGTIKRIDRTEIFIKVWV